MEHSLHHEGENLLLAERAAVDQSLHCLEPRSEPIDITELHVREDKAIKRPILLFRIRLVLGDQGF